MKLQYLNGGLANQVFQYIFVRYAELNFPESGEWFLDDSFFFINNVHNGYELEKVFGLKPRLLSRSLEGDVWQELITAKKRGISIPQSLKDMGFPIIMITEFENYKEHNPFDGELYHVPGNTFMPEIAGVNVEYVYYHGYWLHRGWFDACREALKKELVFPQIMDLVNLEYQKMIQHSESVAVHIRRGDYVNTGWISSNEYYRKAVSELVFGHPERKLFVFSDDIKWCRENEKELGFDMAGDTVYIEGNIGGKNYIDLELMSLCKFMVIGKSAFAYLAMLLNDRLEYCISDQ